MNRIILAVMIVLQLSISSAFGAEKMSYGRFGELTIYGDAARADSVALFVSGDGGWNQGVIDMAQNLVSLNSLVIGIDIRHYLAKLADGEDKCSYPAADFEALSKYVQRQLGINAYIVPVLVGYSSGATLVYATLAQAPPGTFLGAISMGFCLDLPVHKPFCTGYGLKSEKRKDGKGYDFLPTSALKVPWVVFQGDIDQVCTPAEAATFASKVPGAELVSLPKVGHGFSVQKNWLPQFKNSYRSLVARKTAGGQPSQLQTKAPPVVAKADPGRPALTTGTPATVDDLPLVELPAHTDDPMLAIIVTGDGGWAAIDRSLGESLVADGISVVGFNSLKYFWNLKTPEESARDLQRVIRHYLAAWDKKRVVLIGYSQGADVLPFMVSRLADDTKQVIDGIALLGLAREASFEITVSGWVGSTTASSIPIEPELRKLGTLQTLCVYGSEEEDTLCPVQPAPIPGWHSIQMPGGHHFGNDFKKLAGLIMTHFNLRPEHKSMQKSQAPGVVPVKTHYSRLRLLQKINRI